MITFVSLFRLTVVNKAESARDVLIDLRSVGGKVEGGQ